eukprot:SAG31_NODE_757_length_12296_cov_8.840289_4_plen_152_part_00
MRLVMATARQLISSCNWAVRTLCRPPRAQPRPPCLLPLLLFYACRAMVHASALLVGLSHCRSCSFVRGLTCRCRRLYERGGSHGLDAGCRERPGRMRSHNTKSTDSAGFRADQSRRDDGVHAGMFPRVCHQTAISFLLQLCHAHKATLAHA